MHFAKHRLKNLYKETGTRHVSSQRFKENLTFKLKVNKSWTISRPHLYFTCIIGSPYKKFRKTDSFNEMHSGMLGSKESKFLFNCHLQQSCSGNLSFYVPSS